jgi:hypothetical protein
MLDDIFAGALGAVLLGVALLRVQS